MLSRILITPFVLGAIAVLYLTMEVDENYALYILCCIIPAVIIYVFSPQIDWWWYQRYPPKLDGNVTAILQQHYPYYQMLSPQARKKFRNRTALFMMSNQYIPKAMEIVPEDIKGMIAAETIKLTFGYPNFLFKDFETIVIYPHPFPSPQFPKSFHASETFAEDGVTLFSTQQIAQAFFQPKDYFSLPLYEFAKVFIHSYPDEPYPTVDISIWDKLEEISGFSLEAIQKWINLEIKDIDPLACTIYHFFNYPHLFRQKLPDLYESFLLVFRQDPVNTISPVIRSI